MKSIIRILSITLVLALSLLPMAALAEQNKLTTVTTNNYVVSINNEEYPIGIETKFSFGSDDDRFYFAGDVLGGENPVASFKVAGEQDVIKLSMDGLSDNYEITEDELEAFMKQNMSASQQEMPIDPEQLQELVTSYIELLQSATEMEQKSTQSLTEMVEAFKAMGIDLGEPIEEAVEVMGESMTLKRFNVQLGMADIDQMFNYSFTTLPEASKFMDEYFDFMDEMMKASGESIKFDREHMFSSLYGELGADLTMDITIWTDELGENIRVDMVENFSMPVDGETLTISIPFTVQQQTDEQGIHMAMNMDMDQDGVQMSMNMLVNELDVDDNYKADFAMDMSVADSTTEPVKISFNGAYEQVADGSTFDGEMNVDAEDQQVKVQLGLKGTGALDKGEASKTSIDFGVSAKTSEAEQTTFGLSFDVAVEQADLPEGTLLDVSDKPIVRIVEMDADKASKLETEAGTVAVMGYGALMQVPGVAQLLSKAMVAVQEAMTPMLQSTVAAPAALEMPVAVEAPATVEAPAA